MTEKTQQYIARAKAIHGDKYDYSLVKDITTNKQKIAILCKKHGIFNQIVSSHINAKQNCPKCMNAYRKTTKEVIDSIRNVHGEKFSYLPFKYINNKQKIGIECKIHGLFEQGIKEHLNGGGCPKCAKNYKIGNMENFLDKVREKFGEEYLEKFNYSKCVYSGYDDDMTIECVKHGPFMTSPHKHLNGYSCLKCSSQISKKEELWLDSLNVSDMIKQHKLRIDGKIYRIDGYSPSMKTVYEFHGDFFHGNPKFFNKNEINPKAKVTFGDLFERTLQKKNDIEAAGYSYVFIWESDFDMKVYQKKDIQEEWTVAIKNKQKEILHRLQYERLWRYADGEDYSPHYLLNFLNQKQNELI